MLSRIMRSPLVSITLFLGSLGLCYLIKKTVESGEPLSTAGTLFTYFMFTLLGLWVFLVSIHNWKNPKDRINIWGVIPSELLEVDEGQQWVTFKACRNVYIYYSICLPLAILAFIFIPADYVHALITFGLLGLGQYLVYSLTRWTYSRV